MTKPRKWLCTHWRLGSAWASAQSDQSSLSAWWKLGPLATHWAHSKDSDQLWSDWADAQADLSLHWAHSHFVGFVMRRLMLFEPWLSQTYENTCNPLEDSDQPVHLCTVWSESLMSTSECFGSFASQRVPIKDWWNCMMVQADLSLRWVAFPKFCSAWLVASAQRWLKESFELDDIWVTAWENLLYTICEQQWHRSACTSCSWAGQFESYLVA